MAHGVVFVKCEGALRYFHRPASRPDGVIVGQDQRPFTFVMAGDSDLCELECMHGPVGQVVVVRVWCWKCARFRGVDNRS